MFSSLFDR